METKEIKIVNNITYRLEDNIIYVDFQEKVLLNLEKCEKLVEERLKFQEGKSYPLILDMSLVSASKEARDYMKIEGTKDVVAGAFLVSNIFTKTIINFFLSVTSPEVPAKMFTNKEDAIQWLQQYK